MLRFAAAVDESQLERVVLAQGLVQRIKDIVHSKEVRCGRKHKEATNHTAKQTSKQTKNAWEYTGGGFSYA